MAFLPPFCFNLCKKFAYVKIFVYLCTRFGCIKRTGRNLRPVIDHNMAKKNEIVKVEQEQIPATNHIENLIVDVRGKQTMLDRDLAMLYGVTTKRLNEQVKRNIERFPEHFRFQLTDNETEELVANCDRLRMLKHSSVNPFVFTEQGVAMLSTVLHSDTAISVSIQIMDAFTAMRHFIAANAQAFQRLEIIERNQLALNVHLAENDKKFEEVFRRLDDGSTTPKQAIFYDGQIFDAYKFVNERIREAKKRIVLIDNYIDETVLAMLDKRGKDVTAKVYTKNISRQLSLDFEKHNAQYTPIEVEQFDRAHDRFLCIDDTVYLIGASIKDLGKKWFGFVKLEQTTDELLSKM